LLLSLFAQREKKKNKKKKKSAMSNNQEIRRRPFSVSDAHGRQQQQQQQRCQEVKISNTTTITTCTSSQDSAAITTTTYRNVDSRHQHEAGPLPSTSHHHVKKQESASRSRSAYATTTSTTTSPHPCHPNISTNTSITLPIKRKIKFVYGSGDDNQQNLDPSWGKQQTTTGHGQQQQQQPASPNKGTMYEIRRTGGGCGGSSEDLAAFPYVKHSVQTKLPCSTITNCVEINNSGGGGRCVEEYDNYDLYKTTDTSYKTTAAAAGQDTSADDDDDNNNGMDIGTMRIKDVEVEYEIDEDPAIFEGSEGYVKTLINKIQSQYKNPETVHIKITRRQKPESVDRLGSLPGRRHDPDNNNKGQIVRKEYYTVKTVPRGAKKSSSISSFVDQANIPYIDEESGGESRTNSMRSIKHHYVDDYDRQKCLNYIIEQHIIYNDNCHGDGSGKGGGEKRKIEEEQDVYKIKEFLEHLGGSLRLEDLNNIKIDEHVVPIAIEQPAGDSAKSSARKGKRYEIEGPKLDIGIKKPPAVDLDSTAAVAVDVPEVEIDSPEMRGGIKGFFKGNFFSFEYTGRILCAD
jgi:hypothetical protein